MNPFITFYTPTYKRPTYLTICRMSVQMQTCRSFQHMVIVDDTGIGVDGMFRDIRRHAKNIRGRYVYILSDDDKLLLPEGLEKVRAFAQANDNPPVIIVRNHKWGKTFPLLWKHEPVHTKIDTGNFIIRADVFKENADRFGECYEGDYVFIKHLWDKGYPFAWFDYEFSEMQVGGKGMTEVELMAITGNQIKVRAVKSFAALFGNRSYRHSPGDEFYLPVGADWVRSGLCEVVEDKAISLQPSAISPEKSVEEAISVSTETVERAVGRGGRRKR